MDVYNFLKNRYDAFYELLERDCSEKGWDISFDTTKLFHDIHQINGHSGSGISQYPKVCGVEHELPEGWRMVFERGSVERTDSPGTWDGDENIEVYFKGTFYNPNQVEYPFEFGANYFWNDGPSELNDIDENEWYFKQKISKMIPDEVIDDFLEIIRDKARWGN